MPNDIPTRIEVITGVAGRRYWPAHGKLRIVKESLAPGEAVSAVARRNGFAPNLLSRWRPLMAERGAMAVGKNEPVAGAGHDVGLRTVLRTSALDLAGDLRRARLNLARQLLRRPPISDQIDYLAPELRRIDRALAGHQEHVRQTRRGSGGCVIGIMRCSV